jgi:hypothetical protein
MSERDPSKYFWRDRWRATDNPTGASAAACTAPAGVIASQARPHLETILGSIWNSNAASTVQLQVRIASAAGTVICALDNIVNTSTVGQINLVSLGLPGKRGAGFWVGFNTAVASLTTKLSIAGWTEDANG